MGMSRAKAPTLRQFQERFPTEEMLSRPSDADPLRRSSMNATVCGRDAKFYRVTKRRSYACEWCGYQVYPTAGTPFDRDPHPLRDWFYRHVPVHHDAERRGREAGRARARRDLQDGVAHVPPNPRSTWRALDSDDPLGGLGAIVEIDETLVGGSVERHGQRLHGEQDHRRRDAGAGRRAGYSASSPDRRKAAMHGLILANVLPGTTIYTDEMGGYKDIDQSRLSPPDREPQSRRSTPPKTVAA